MRAGRTAWWQHTGKPAVAAIVALALLASPARAQAPGSAAGQTARPNIVFILTDDQDVDTLSYMPRLQALLADEGTTFENTFVTQAVCCPSHASILRGQHSHNTQIMQNQPPLGGFEKFRDLGGEQSTFATWLQAAGYHTGRIGKYLIGYDVESLYVPPGWNDWQGFPTSAYLGFSMNDNGRLMSYGDEPEDYATDVQFNRAVALVERAPAGNQPFFLFLSPPAPHGDRVINGPALPAPRHDGQFWDHVAPRAPSFNEADVSDKPPAVRNLPPLDDDTIVDIDHEFRTRIESLQAVDEGIERLIGALGARGALDNTYVFFTSDNGYHLGQRIVRGKGTPYEEDIRVPLVVRGPGVPAGVTRPEFVLNIDFAPTFAELSGVTPGHEVDGRSLVPLLRGEPAPSWRMDFLVENYTPAGVGTYLLRTEQYAYIERSTGFVELYNLWTDPYELESLHEVADPALLADLSARLAGLLGCAGASCRD